MKKTLTINITAWLLVLLVGAAQTASAYEYQLYKNHENFGIVVFPKKNAAPELADYFRSIVFEPVQSGRAEMRYGSKGENETFMMPLEVQRKWQIEKFVVVQVLDDGNMLIGIFDPEWGLTLPSTVFDMDRVQENIPKTLNVFRGGNKQRET